MKNFVLGLALTCLIGFLSLAASSEAFSQTGEDSVGLSIVPAIVDLPLANADSFSIQVTNISEQSLPVQVGSRAVTPFDPNVDPNQRQRYDASLWLKPETTALVLAPQETSSINFKVEAPSDAGPGGHYALVVFRVVTPQPDTGSSSAKVNPEITSIVLLTVPGDLNEAAQLKLVNSPWQWSPVQRFAFELTNTGNVHILPSSQFIVTNLAGDVQATLPAPARLVLPGTVSRFETDWQPDNWGIYRVRVATSFGTPLRLLDSSQRLFVVWPPIWIQAVAMTLLATLAYFGRRAARNVGRRLKRPRRLARDQTGRPSNLSATRLDELSSTPGTRDISHKKR